MWQSLSARLPNWRQMTLGSISLHTETSVAGKPEKRKLLTPQPVWDAAVRPQSDDRRICIMRDSNEKPPPPKRPLGKLLCSPRLEAKETAAYFRKAFSHWQPAPTGALTPAEIEARKRRAKEYFRRAFAHLRPKANG
jgi:hypothetical protein